MERFNRAVRRYHLERMKRRARRIYPWSGVRAERLANHLAVCSGPCCGNPRHWGGGPTRAERLAAFEDSGRVPPVRGSKRRARWCRGRPGVEHQLRWQPTPGWEGLYDLVCSVCERLFWERYHAQDGSRLVHERLLKRRRWSIRGKARHVPPLPTE